MNKFERLCAAVILVSICAGILMGASTIVSPLLGGTGLSNPSAHAVLVTEGSSPMTAVGGGTTGTCFEGNTGADPSWQNCPTSGGTSGGGFAWGGTGLDGAITADGSTTIPCLGAPGTHNTITSSYLMVEDCNATTFTVNSGVTVIPQQTRIFATVSIAVNGTIRSSSTNGGIGGNGAASGTAGAAGNTPVADNNAPWASSPVSCLWGSSSICTGSAGGDPYTTGKTGGAGSATANGGAGSGGSVGPSAAALVCPSNGVAGTAGGNGGQSGGGVHGGGNGGAGGAAPTCTVGTLSEAMETLPIALTWLVPSSSGSGGIVQGGYVPGTSGSGSGGAGGGDGSVAGGGGGGSGAPGGPGNQIILSSPTITIGATGVLNADGSNGGNGGNGGTPASGNAGGGGGGAGGSGGNGGAIILIYHSYSSSGSVHANGGTKGTKGTHGNGAGTGSNGVDGNDGNNGIAGLILQIPQ